MKGNTVFEYRTTEADNRDEATQQAGIRFLEAHGVDQFAFPLGNDIVVRQSLDNSSLLSHWWLTVWRAVGNDLRTAPMCTNCPNCFAQERIEVPLVAPIPLFPGAFVSDAAVADGLPVAPILALTPSEAHAT